MRSTRAFACAVLLSLHSGCVNLTPEDDGFGTSHINHGGSDKAVRNPLLEQSATDPAEQPGTMSRLTKKLTAAFDSDPAKKSSNSDEDPLSAFTPVAPPTADYHVTVARLHERGKKFDTAAMHYQKALRLDAKHVPAIIGLARLHDRQGNLPAATKVYNDAIARQPREAALYNDLGLCHARRKNFPQALAALNKAVQIEPQRALYRNNLAMVLVETNQFDQAVTQLSAVSAPAVAHYNVGYLLQKRGQRDAALRHFQQSAQHDPGYQPAQQWLSKLTAPATEQVARHSGTGLGIEVSAPTRSTAPQADQQPATSTAAAESVAAESAPPDLLSETVDDGREPMLLPAVDEESDLAAAPSPDSMDEYLNADEHPLRPRTVAYDAMEALPPVDEGYQPPSRY